MPINNLLQAAEAKKEVGKEQAKGNIPGQNSISDRISGAADAISGAVDEHKYKTTAEGQANYTIYPDLI